jgi:hypothetical protein
MSRLLVDKNTFCFLHSLIGVRKCSGSSSRKTPTHSFAHVIADDIYIISSDYPGLLVLLLRSSRVLAHRPPACFYIS